MSNILKSSATRLCVNPEWRLRPGEGRAILYKNSTEELMWRAVPPVMGFALSFFDGYSTLAEIGNRLGEALGDEAKARDMLGCCIKNFYRNEDDTLIEPEKVADGDWYVYDPEVILSIAGGFSGKKRLEAPISMVLMPFNQCAVDCVYCYAERKPIAKRDVMSIGRWREIIVEAAGAGISIATFSGGDPMIYPDIMALLDLLIAHDFEFVVSTKSAISAEQAKRLSEMGYGKRFYQISLDGTSDTTTESMLRRPRYYRSAIQSIRHLLAEGIRVQTNTVCTPRNYREVPGLVEKLAQMGVSRCLVTGYGRSMYRHDDAMFLDDDMLVWLGDRVDAVKERYADTEIRFNATRLDYNEIEPEQKKLRWENRSGCSGGRSSVTICADGRVLLCEQMPHEDQYTAGNLKQQGLLEIWNSERMMQLAYPSRESFEGGACFDCDAFEECMREKGYCFRDSLNAFGNAFRPAPGCPRAPKSPRFS